MNEFMKNLERRKYLFEKMAEHFDSAKESKDMFLNMLEQGKKLLPISKRIKDSLEKILGESISIAEMDILMPTLTAEAGATADVGQTVSKILLLLREKTGEEIALNAEERETFKAIEMELINSLK